EPVDATGLTAGRLADAVLPAPFLDPYRIVWVRGVAAARAEGLAPGLAEVPVTTRLLIVIAGRLSQSNKLVKAAITAGGRAEESVRLKGRALNDWATRRAEQLGLTRVIAAQVTRVTHADAGVVDSELQKLAAYKASGAKF